MIWPECGAGVWEGSMSDTPVALPALPDLASNITWAKSWLKNGEGIYVYLWLIHVEVRRQQNFVQQLSFNKKKVGATRKSSCSTQRGKLFFFFHNKLVVLFRFDFNKCVREKIWLRQFGKRIKKNSNLTLEAYWFEWLKDFEIVI